MLVVGRRVGQHGDRYLRHRLRLLHARRLKYEHRRVQLRQHIVVQHAAGAPVDHLAFGQALALERHQAARHLGAGLRVDQALAGGAGDLDLLLGVQPAVALIAQQQHADQPALAPQRHRPDRAAVVFARQRHADHLG